MMDFIKIFLIVIFGAICISSEVFASSIINSVEIKPLENSFDVILNSADKIKIKKNFSQNKIIFTLKNTKPSKNFSMKYNNSDLDDVVVKTSKNDTKIILKSDKIVPQPKDNHIGYFLFGIITVGILFSKLINNEKEDFKVAVKTQYSHNLDFLVQHKLKQKEEQKTKIAA